MNPMKSLASEGEWELVDDSFKCSIAATSFSCRYNYKAVNLSAGDSLRLYIGAVGNSTGPICIIALPVALGEYGQYQAYIAGSIFLIIFIVLAFEIVSRALVTMIGDILLFGLLWAFQGKPGLDEVMSWLDWATIVLLCSMMIICAIFADTGFFEWASWTVLKFSRRRWANVPLVKRKWRILIIMGFMTMTASAFLDNCTTVLLFAPVMMQTAKLLESDPIPLLITMIYFCSLGGAMTYVGDPPNLLIGGQFNLGFNAFLLNCAPPILFILPFSIGIMYLQFRYRMRLIVRRASDGIEERVMPVVTAATSVDDERTPLRY